MGVFGPFEQEGIFFIGFNILAGFGGGRNVPFFLFWIFLQGGLRFEMQSNPRRKRKFGDSFPVRGQHESISWFRRKALQGRLRGPMK